MSLLRRKPDGTYETFYGEIEAEAYAQEPASIAEREAKETQEAHEQRTGHRVIETYTANGTSAWICTACQAYYPRRAS